MDRKTRRVTYMTGANSTLRTYGMSDEKKKKKKGLPQRLKMVFALLALGTLKLR